jgi:hypothetical protein
MNSSAAARAAEARTQLCAMAAAIADTAQRLAGTEEHTASLLEELAATRVERAPGLLALAAEARRHAADCRASQGRWQVVAEGRT